MDDENQIICPMCQKKFESIRGLSVHRTRHCKAQQKKNTHDTRFSSGSFKTYSTRSTSEHHKNKKLKSTLERDEGATFDTPMFSSTEHDLLEKSFESNISDLKNSKHIDQDIILKQDQNHKIASSTVLTDYQSQAEIDLLKIISDLNCHNTAYERVMAWASFWNTKKVSFQNTPSYTYYNRDVVIRKLSKRHDMDQMKPIQSKVDLFNLGEDFDQRINVTSFDFQQQVLSLLRDQDLMQPKNLVLDYEPGEKPIFKQEKISEINHSDWYESAYNHYLKIKGYDSHRVICGIVFAIDKTHTDTKGKLCLESVNFTLSIFNTQTRRTNYRAWRSLGFINDLNTKYGTGLDVTSNKSARSNVSFHFLFYGNVYLVLVM